MFIYDADYREGGCRMKQLLVFLVFGLSLPWSPILKEETQMMTIQDKAINDSYHDPVVLQVRIPFDIDVKTLRLVRKIDGKQEEEIVCAWKKEKMYYQSDIPIKDGDFIQYCLYDKRNNKQIYSSSKFTVDTIKPTLHVVYDGDDRDVVQAAYAKEAEMQIYFTDAHLDHTQTTIQMYEDGKELKPKKHEGTSTYRIKKGKQYHLETKAMDTVGNVTMYKTSSTFYVDDQIPTGTLYFQDQPIKQKEYVMFDPGVFTLKVQDEHFNQEKSSILVNGERIHTAWDTRKNIGTQTWQHFEEGTFDIGYHLEDMAGNVTEMSSVHVIQDFTAPIVQYKIDGNTVEEIPEISQEIQSLEWIILDQTLDIQRSYIQVDQTNIPITKEKEGMYHAITKLEAGTHQIQMKLIDQAGRITQKEHTIYVDDQSPIVSVSHIPRYINKTTSIHFKIQDEYILPEDIHVTLRNDQGEILSTAKWETNHHTYEADMVVEEEGNYVVEVLGYDKAGNQVVAMIDGQTEALVDNTYAFTIDKQAPIVSYHLDQEASYINQDQKVSITIEDLHMRLRDFTLECKKDGNIIPKNPTSKDGNQLVYQFNEDGMYTLSLSMKDLAGNNAIYKHDSTIQSTPIQFTIDKIKPDIQLTGLEHNNVTNMACKANVTVVDKQLKSCSVMIQRNQEHITKACSNEPIVFDEVSGAVGEYRVYVEAQDDAGNKATSQTYNFVIDRKPPAITFLLNEKQIQNNETYLTNQDVQIHMDWVDQNLSSYHFSVNKDGVRQDVITKEPSTDYSITAQKGEKHVYTLLLEGEDQAQNKVAFTTTIIVDARTPIPRIEANMISNTNGIQRFTPKLKNDGRNYQVISYTLTQNHNVVDYVWGDEIKEDGKYLLDVMVVDEAMNVAHLQDPLYFEIDTIPPNIIVKQGNRVLQDFDTISNEALIILLQQSDKEKALKETFTKLIINDQEINDFKRDEQGNIYYRILPNDDVTITATAIDDAGNSIDQTWNFTYHSNNTINIIRCIFYSGVVIVGLFLICCYGKQRKDTRTLSL